MEQVCIVAMRFFRTTSFLLTAAVLLSCRNAQPPVGDEVPVTGPGSSAVRNYNDAKYLAKVYGSLVTQQKINSMAIRKSRTPAVAALASDLLNRYEALSKETERLAGDKHIALAPKLRFDQENHIRFLEKEPEATFDREYIDIQMRQHKKFLEDFRLTGTNSYDPDISMFSAEILKIIAESYSRIMVTRTKIHTE